MFVYCLILFGVFVLAGYGGCDGLFACGSWLLVLWFCCDSASCVMVWFIVGCDSVLGLGLVVWLYVYSFIGCVVWFFGVYDCAVAWWVLLVYVVWFIVCVLRTRGFVAITVNSVVVDVCAWRYLFVFVLVC